MNETYEVQNPIACGRCAGKLAVEIVAGNLDFGDVRFAALEYLSGTDITGDDLDWIVERVRQITQETPE